MKQVTCNKGMGKYLVVAWVLALAAGTPQMFAAEEITGDWEITMDFGGRESFAALSIAKKADGTLTGKWGSSELSDVKFEGQKLTFVRVVRFGDQEFKMNYAGTLKDGKITGTMSSDRGEFAANGARTKPKPPVLGQWDLSYRIAERDVTARLSISQKPDGTLEANWTSGFGESVVSNVKLQDGKLSFSRKTKFNDNSFESTFEGTVKGDKLTGTSKSERGEIAVNGQRVGSALIGKWELTSTSERGTRTGMLTVYGDMTARYEMFGGEIPVNGLKLEGDQVTFYIEFGSADQPFKMEFKGKLDGKNLKGQMVSERGTSEVTGKKAGAASALVGTWELTTVSSQGTTRTNTLKIKEDMTGTYTGRGNEMPITDLKVEADQVTFKVTMKFNEQEFPMEFKGKLDGESLKGEFTSSRGTREVTGKKVNANP